MQDLWRMDLSEHDVTIKYKGKEDTLTIKPMTWSKKNQILSQCMSYASDNQARFNLDNYNKECLAYMIVKAPWGKTDRVFLSQIDEELGRQLEKLIPGPFEEMENQDFFEEESDPS